MSFNIKREGSREVTLLLLKKWFYHDRDDLRREYSTPTSRQTSTGTGTFVMSLYLLCRGREV